MKQLSKAQIDSLFDFVKKHYVEWYDLQLELVDHLATDIENIMDKNPNISFEKARDIAFKKFGITGFYDVIEARKRAIHKHILRLLVKEMFSVVLSLKIIFFMGLWLLFYKFFINFPKINKYIFFTVLFFLLIFSMITIIRYKFKMQKELKQKNKIFLYESVLFNDLNLIFILLTQSLNVWVNTLHINSVWATNHAVSIALLITFLYLFIYVGIFIVPDKIKQEYRKKYFNLC